MTSERGVEGSATPFTIFKNGKPVTTPIKEKAPEKELYFTNLSEEYLQKLIKKMKIDQDVYSYNYINYLVWTTDIIAPDDLYVIFENMTEVFEKEPSIGEIKLRKGEEITIVGDIRGHVIDLLHIFNTMGFPSTRKYIFNGNLIGDNDRFGRTGLECLIILFGYKLLFPENIYFTRGENELFYKDDFFFFFFFF